VSPHVKNFHDPRTHRSAQADIKPVEHLRALKRLAVVDLDFVTSPFYLDEFDAGLSELYGALAVKDLGRWKAFLVEVLKDSPSKERKFLRWKVYKGKRHRGFPREVQMVVDEGELEVFPETSL